MKFAKGLWIRELLIGGGFSSRTFQIIHLLTSPHLDVFTNLSGQALFVASGVKSEEVPSNKTLLAMTMAGILKVDGRPST